MLFALLLFLVYFGIGVLVVLSLWAIRIRFGNASDLDPQSFLVRLFGRKGDDAAHSSQALTLKSLEPHHLQLLRELSAQAGELNKPEQHARVRTRVPAEIKRFLADESLTHKDVQHTVDELMAVLKGGEVSGQSSKGLEFEDYPELAHGARIQ